MPYLLSRELKVQENVVFEGLYPQCDGCFYEVKVGDRIRIATN